jgi:DNA-binding LacI/PurR family transcriptional regulator
MPSARAGQGSAPAAQHPAQILATSIRRPGLTVPSRLVATTVAATADEGRRCCQVLLTAGATFTVIVTGSDMLAAGYHAALAAADSSCPDDVSVTGFGDLPRSGSLSLTLTSIRLPQCDVGAAAARLLVAQLRQPAEPAGSLQLAPILLARESTGHAVRRRPSAGPAFHSRGYGRPQVDACLPAGTGSRRPGVTG